VISYGYHVHRSLRASSSRPFLGRGIEIEFKWCIWKNHRADVTSLHNQITFRRQSPQGKILHEWSQTADLVDWKGLPYAYAAADATVLLPMAMNDYLRISGDKQFIDAHWDNLVRAWQFECAHDEDGDGIYGNSEGTAWVESWVPRMPRQEICLAVLDKQASLAFANLARAEGRSDLAASAEARAAKISRQVESEYYKQGSDSYAFSWNGSEGADATDTIFPAVAWWDGDYKLDHGQKMFSSWASSEFSTDWGTRLTNEHTSFYDPISYHQGSVWPLFTGWVSVAEYRTGHALSGYAHPMQNANLTWSQDLGNVTEILSGRFFQPLGRSSAHQLWSSAMVISPVVRGMFGLEWDLPANTLNVPPHLPADWQDATVRSVPFGTARVDLKFTRTANDLVVEAIHAPAGLHLASHAAGAHLAGAALHIPLPELEVAIASKLPEFGAETSQSKVLDEKFEAHRATLILAGTAGETCHFKLRENAQNMHVHAEGANMGAITNGLREAAVTFPAGAGYVTTTVVFSW